MTKCHFTSLLLCACFLAGCSGLKPYPDNLTRNLDIHTRTESGSIISNTRASLDVYSVGTGCIAEYEGSIALSASTVSVGLPANRPSYLAFRFNSTSFLASSSSVTSYNTLFTPRQDQRYNADVSYIDNIYNVVIREKSSATPADGVVEPKDLRACNQ